MEHENNKLAVLSGKGGVGKSMVASSLAILFSKDHEIAAVDCDVDAPNLAIWLNETGSWEKEIPVVTSAKPVIDYKKCDGCGICIKKCRFQALERKKNKLKPQLNPFLCEGCGVCEIVCPKGAVKLKPVQNGEIKIKKTKYGFPLIVGNLFPGETGSGKVITELKKEADGFKKELQVLDCSPGTGCPVIACLQDSNFVILVTEPTLSGFSDLKRVLELINYFHTPYKIIINKHDLNLQMSRRIEKWAGGNFLGKISYDQKIMKAVSNFTPVLETNLRAKKEIEKIFNNLNLF